MRLDYSLFCSANFDELKILFLFRSMFHVKHEYQDIKNGAEAPFFTFRLFHVKHSYLRKPS